MTTENNFGRDARGRKMGRSIYQQYTKLPVVQNRVIQTSVWIVGGMPAGINFREGRNGTDFEDGNPFLLHTVSGTYLDQLDLKMTSEQAKLRKDLYKGCNFDIYGRYKNPNGDYKCSVDDNLPQFRKDPDGNVAGAVKPYTAWIQYE